LGSEVLRLTATKHTVVSNLQLHSDSHTLTLEMHETFVICGFVLSTPKAQRQQLVIQEKIFTDLMLTPDTDDMRRA
jgi:hypothetical protein